MITMEKLLKLLAYRKHKKLFWSMLVVLGTALGVFFLLLYLNFSFLHISGHFASNSVYDNSILLFFHKDCSYCDKVDTYLNNNNIDQKVSFTRLDIDISYNKNVLADKIQTCALDIKKVGVPFLWDGRKKRCIMGYVDIIDFFKQEVKNTSK